MDILKIATAGNVDDGKSTLIGRLLHDTNSVTKDKLESIALISKKKGLDFVDLSLLTDGLMAEIEQGITIDVAHIYFSTDTRKYIIADSPGHFEYTRNMITGASTAAVFILLIDARKGVTEQTKRHLFIAALLNIGTTLVCINKMDLVDFKESVFTALKKEIGSLAGIIGLTNDLVFTPIAAKYGDNIVTASTHMSWYHGKPLLHYLEEVPVHVKDLTLPLRLPVQAIIRPHSETHPDYRGYAGKLLSGTIEVGQAVTVLPSMQPATVISILHAQQVVEKAIAGQSITIELNEDLDISRGNMIVTPGISFLPSTKITATLCWLNEQHMIPGNNYLLQHGVNIVKAKMDGVERKLDIETMEELKHTTALKLNDIGKVLILAAQPVLADLYRSNPGNGAFILIDEFTNNTVAVGFIEALK